MIQQFLKTSILRRSICTSCYQRRTTAAINHNKRLLLNSNNTRSFHSTRPSQVPIVPIPAIILGALKTGKLVSLVSLWSKTSLTLLPHTFRRGSKGETIAKVLAGIPVFGFTLLVVVGLDQAPNTSRLRLIYLSEEEEKDIVEAEIKSILEAQSGLVAPKDSEVVMWLQTIVDNLAASAVDDVRDPVRHYGEEKQNQKSRQIQVVPTMPTSGEVDVMVSTKQDAEGEFRPSIPQRDFYVNVIWDSSTVNAMCAGSSILVYNLLIHYMDYDTTKMAVILSHEIAHSIQRHFVEQHGFASLMFMLGDISRGVFWMVTESLGPYINQKINEYISTFITLETQTTYNRRLEKEADLVGLKILAKAGYDPRAAVDVWQKMADLETMIEEEVEQEPKKEKLPVDRAVAAAKRSVPQQGEIKQEEEKYEDLEYGVREFLDSLVNSWFGSSHPPNQERIEYMREHMDEAIALYEDALRINGPPTEFVFSEDVIREQELQLNELHLNGIFGHITYWLTSLYAWTGAKKIDRNNTHLLISRSTQ